MVLVAKSSLFFFVWVGLLKRGFFLGETEVSQYSFSGEIFLPLAMLLLDPIGEVYSTSNVSICEITDLSRSDFTWTGSTNSTKFGSPTREEVVLGYLEVFNNWSLEKFSRMRSSNFQEGFIRCRGNILTNTDQKIFQNKKQRILRIQQLRRLS